MANRNNNNNPATNPATTPTATATPLHDLMAASHASRAPNGKGPRHGRHTLDRMPSAYSVRGLGVAIAAAIAAGSVDQTGAVRIVPADLIAAGIKGGTTWCNNQHGWYANQTCQRSAAVHGYVGKLYNATTDQRYVVLRPVAPVAPIKGTGKGAAVAYKADLAAHSTAVALQALAASDPAAYLATWRGMLPAGCVA
jgi:hypothetical protein